MNQSLNIQQPSDLHWTSENWEQQSAGGAVHGAVMGVEPRHYYQGNRSEWDWDNQMLLAQNPAASGNTDDGERKMQLFPGFMRPYNGVIQSNFSSNGFPQQNQLGMYGGPTGFQGFAGHGMVENTQSFLQSPSPLHAALPFASMAAGVVPGNGYGDLRSFEQRRRLFGLLEMDPRSLCDSVKREDLYADAHARIGLNLGVRTYFSTEDTLARLGKRPRANSPGAQVPLCQAEGCKADLSAAKHYHRRHKVCELHSKAATVTANGQTQRFCQQCSRFHPLTEFDEGKRSCRKRLADHNRRRRKPQPNASAATSESTAKEDETDATQDNGADDKLGSSPTTSLENSDSKTGSGDSLQLRTSCTSTKTEGNSGAHSTLLGDQPTEPDTQALLSALSPPVSLMQNSKRQGQTEESTYEQLLHGANLSLSSTGSGQSSVGNHPVSWLKPLELNTDSTSNQLINFQDKSGQSTPMGTSVGSSSSPQVLSPSVQKLLPLQSSRDIAGSDWILSSMTKQSRSDQAEQYDSTFQAALDGHQILGLLENPLTAQQSRTQPMEFLQEQSSFNNGSDQDAQSRQPSRLKLSELQPFGSSMFQSM